MSVARAREVRDRLRAMGFTVHEWAGWESRGNGQSSAYEGAIWHHTASSYGSAYGTLVHGRSDLPGPLCNFSGNSDGSFTLIAAHPANHAGASGGYGTAPLPVTSVFNKRVMGLEIVYPGNSPMTAAQYKGLLAWGKVTTDVFGYGDINRVKGHRETSITGKWDPGYAPGKTIDLHAARVAARDFTGGGGGSTPPAPKPIEEEDDLMQLQLTDANDRSKVRGVAFEVSPTSAFWKRAWVQVNSDSGKHKVWIEFYNDSGVIPNASADLLCAEADPAALVKVPSYCRGFRIYYSLAGLPSDTTYNNSLTVGVFGSKEA